MCSRPISPLNDGGGVGMWMVTRHNIGGNRHLHFGNTTTDSSDCFRPCASAGLEPSVEAAALTGALSDRAGGNTERRSDGLDFSDKEFSFVLHSRNCSVKNHTTQREISHSPPTGGCGISLTMTEGEIFRENLLREMEEQGLNEAQLSVMAGLNRRAVTDIRERRTLSPKISTVFALARALKRDPAEMMGLGPRYRLCQDLAMFLEQYEPEDQARFLAALRAIPRLPS